MSLSKHSILTAVAAGMTAAVISAGAWAQAAPVAPGATGVTIPTYSGPVPTYTILADTGVQSDVVNIGGTPTAILFDEVVVNTSLNPAAVSFGFIIGTTNNASSLSATLPGFSLPGGLTTSVEGCNPFTAAGGGTCSTAAGVASRSSGSGDVLSFNLNTTAVSLPTIGTTYLTDSVAIFTNAHAFIDPSVTVMDDGVTAVFSGFAPAVEATSVPEPATLALLGLGLLGTAVVQRRRRALTPL